MNINEIKKNTTLKGKIYLANTLYSENGIFKYTGIYPIEEYYDYEGEEIPVDYITEDKNYYTFMDGELLLLSISEVERIVNRFINEEMINIALEKVYKADDYLKSLIDVAVNDF